MYGDIGGVLLIRIEWAGAIRDVEERWEGAVCYILSINQNKVGGRGWTSCVKFLGIYLFILSLNNLVVI